MNKLINLKNAIGLLAVMILMQFSVSSCISDEPTKQNFYTFKGEMLTDYLQNRSDKYSDFIQVLQRAKIYDILSTYGHYTCFAPINSAMETYLSEKGLKSVTELTDSECDTLAYTHLIKVAYFTADLNDGVIPTTNMNDRYLDISSDTSDNKIVYIINKNSQITIPDDSVENGVVHTINRVLSTNSDMLPELLGKDSTISLFYKALVLTGFGDSVRYYIDQKYSVTEEEWEKGVYYHTGNEWETGYYPKQRKFKFTAFVEPNSVYAEHGIDTTKLDGLIAYAKEIYDATYPEDAGLYDNDFTNRKNPLNRFVAYHFLDRLGNFNELTISGDVKRLMQVSSKLDASDAYESMCPHTVIKVNAPSTGLFLNRKGEGEVITGEDIIPGVKVYAPSDTKVNQSCANGIYHYIRDILTYDVATRDIVFNCRFRLDATTLSSDFMSSGARGRAGTATCTAFKNRFVKDWAFSDETFVSVRNRHIDFDSYQGDEIVLLGKYDFTFKLPPVPEGTYEIRLGYCAMSTRGIIQTFFVTKSNGKIIKNTPCGIPLDLRVSATHPTIGWVADKGAGTSEEDKVVDKSMHNRGYMKGPDAIQKNWGGTSTAFRNETQTFRRILTTKYLSSTEDYYIHIKQVMDDDKHEFAFDYIELCPKSVYSPDSATGEGENIH